MATIQSIFNSFILLLQLLGNNQIFVNTVWFCLMIGLFGVVYNRF